MFSLSRVLIACSFILLTACASPSGTDEQILALTNYPVQEPESAPTGSIYADNSTFSLFSDIKARRVGDIVTVYLVEQTSGQNSSDSSLSQGLSTNISAPTFGGSTRNNMTVDLTSGRSFTGDSNSSQSNQLNGSITVTVRDILPGGNLLVAGEKWIQINQSKEHISLQGVVRVKDIGPDNSLYSTQIADARISYAGAGANKDANTMGWAARIVFNSIWPF